MGRHQFRFILIKAVAGLLISSSCASAAIQVEKITYRTWPDSYRITNGDVEMIVVPAIGRIMHYSLIGGPNVLWQLPPAPSQSRWTNHGGDKLWLWPQSQWVARTGKDWPPPIHMDGTPHTLEIINGRTIRLISPTIPAFAGRFIREIQLADRGTTLTLNNRFEYSSLETHSSSSVPTLQLWSVTQIPLPGELQMKIENIKDQTAYSHIMGPMWTPHLTNSQAVLKQQPDLKSKVGFRATTISAVYPTYIFTQQLVTDSPPEIDQSQIYANTIREELPDSMYAEMEFLSPKQNTQLQMQIIWTITTPDKGGRSHE